MSDWVLEDGLFVEPRLKAAGLRHGMTAASAGDMGRPELRAAFGAPVTLKQVHGRTILRAAPDADGREGDGLVSRGPGPAVGVYSADCLPVLMWSDDGAVVGAFHAGWRGLAAGMLEAAAASFEGPVSAAVGPHIGACCYEVGPELEPRFAPSSFSRDGARLMLDLGAEARVRLRAAGLEDSRIGVSGLCTACRPELFSWRRDGVRRNMMAFIAPL
ncbi:MAG: polyphenol oxidase family protein [Elusimicrobia bacterium]|nr:polyphenol oxidase family protein [Elusimicrobiota bacterium]